MHTALLRCLVLLHTILLLTACSMDGYEDRYEVSDEEVEEVVEDSSYRGDLRKREDHPTRTVQQMRSSARDTGTTKPGTRTLTLRKTLTLALDNNRDLLNQMEETALARIDALVEKQRYRPVIQPVTVSHNRRGTDPGLRGRQSEQAEMAVQQRLPAGGDVRFGTRLSNRHGNGIRDSEITPFLSTRVPLLRGGGLITAQNELVNTVRAKRYARRELKDFKQTFLINVIERYFSILQQRKAIQNIENRLKSARQLRQQSDILFEFGDISKVDVFRARFQETEAQRDLQIAQEQLKLTKDALKIDLNLPQSITLELKDKDIEYNETEFSQQKFVRRALNNNLLWQNRKEQLEDAKRRLVVADNETLPSLDVRGAVERRYGGEANFRNRVFDETEWNLGLTLDMPIDRTFLNRDLHRSITRFQQEERDVSLARDRLIQRIRERINQLRQARFNVRGNRESVEQARQAVELLEYQYSQGEVDNRDLIEEQNNLLRSQNNLLEARVDWKIRRLELKQEAGQLSVQNRMKWINSNG